jgi:nucleoside-diphosphate-sugar epimerase
MLEWFNVIVAENAGGLSSHDLRTKGVSWVDVRDLANAHGKALQVKEAGGERIIVCGGEYPSGL